MSSLLRRLAARLRSRDALVVLVFLAACAALLRLDLGDTGRGEHQHGLLHHKARVLAADDSAVRRNAMIRTGEQRLQVELLAGPHRGATLPAVNLLTGQMSIDEFYTPGDTLLLQYSSAPDSRPAQGVARGHYRIDSFLWLFGLFVALLLAVSGGTGAKAVLSFVFAALMVWKVMVPLYLRGWNPLAVGMGVLLPLSFAICFLVGGLNRRGLAAFLGTILGLGITLALAWGCTGAFHIHGAVRHYSETLLYSGFPYLQVTPIFVAGIVFGCSGAVMDVAMDIASAMDELKLHNPALTPWAHVRSGLSVGRAVTGTMTTTLLLAYSSSAIAMLMLFYSQGLPLVRILNIGEVSAECVNIVIGSIGAISVAPFTALVGGLVWRTPRRPTAPSSAG